MKKEKVIACGVFLLLVVGMIIGYVLGKKSYEVSQKKAAKSDTVEVEVLGEDTYYIYKGDYGEEYTINYVDFNKINRLNIAYMSDEEIDEMLNNFNKQGIFSYKEYLSYMKQWGMRIKYEDDSKDYLIISHSNIGSPNVDVKLADVKYKSDNATVYMYENFIGITADITGYAIIIPVEKRIDKFDIKLLVTEKEFENIQENGSSRDYQNEPIWKPLIYIYPEKDMDISIKLSNPELLSTTYPKYNNGWNVRVLKDGTIKYDGKEFYGLYWEGSGHEVNVTNEGFVVKGEDVVTFLEEKLAILGLNEREANEFIIYWLPKMEHNKYNYIRFETREEIDSYMKLDITPKPDSVIRVVMDFKALDEKIDVKEQKLETASRTGYTVVEWGGSEIR
jgi:hypothetical protein